jgi:probable F420-dependent oxidoreductase
MQFWLPLMFEPPEQSAAIARLAEEVGFEGLCLADHLVLPDGYRSVHPSGGNAFVYSTSFLDPFVLIGHMATATTRLRFMSFVYLVALRDPMSVAKQVGTAAILSGNRVVFGVGVGWLREEFEALGIEWSTRGRRADEALAVIRDFWADGTAHGDGPHFRFPESSMQPVPPAGIPILAGGQSDAALRRAVRNDGWLGMGYPLAEVLRLLARLRALRDEAGDDRKDFEVFVTAAETSTVDDYLGLAAEGVTATLGSPWYPGDPAFRDLATKRAALEEFARRIIEPTQAVLSQRS